MMDVSLQTQSQPFANTKLSSHVTVGEGTFRSMLAQGGAIHRQAEDGDSTVQSQNELEKAFNQFVGESLYGQLMKSLRSSTGNAAYFDGGRAEEMFQAQLDQQITQRLAAETGHQLTGPMMELFHLQMAK